MSGNFGNFNLSPDRKYFYFTSEGVEPRVQRLRVADHQIEAITSLKNLRRVADWVEETQTMLRRMVPRCSLATLAPRKSTRSA